MALSGLEPTDIRLEKVKRKRKRVVSVVKAARAARVVPVAKAVPAAREVKADQLVAKVAVLLVAVVLRPSSASATSSLINISISERLENKLVAK